MRGKNIAEWWSLGDMVGYGADPVYCARTCLTHAARCLAGNHDLAVAARIDRSVFTAAGQEALKWSSRQLGPSLRAEIGRLLPSDPGPEVSLFHASPRDPVWEYVVNDHLALENLKSVDSDLTFIGHTHVPSAWHLSAEGEVSGGQIEEPSTVDLTPGRWLINPGSIGQPRDGDARAAWAIHDTDVRQVHFVRTPYDVANAQNAILNAGLPENLANRLSIGR